MKDFDGQPTTAAFVVRDKLGHVYPNPARRLAPDFFFHNQVYRADGESISLPPGEYTVEISRGPEYLIQHTTLDVKPGVASQPAEFHLTRWIHPAEPALVFRRSSRACGRMRPLRQSHRRRDPGRHDAAHPRRRPERRLRAELGALLVHAKAIFRGESLCAVAARLSDAVRRRGVRLSVVALRPFLPAAFERGRLSRHDGSEEWPSWTQPSWPGESSKGPLSATAIADTACSSPITCPAANGNSRTPAEFRAPGTDARPTRCPITPCRSSTASAPTNTS